MFDTSYLALCIFGIVAICLFLILRYDFRGWSKSSVFRLVVLVFGIAILVETTMMLVRK
jgi:hypothetical protein